MNLIQNGELGCRLQGTEEQPGPHTVHRSRIWPGMLKSAFQSQHMFWGERNPKQAPKGITAGVCTQKGRRHISSESPPPGKGMLACKASLFQAKSLTPESRQSNTTRLTRRRKMFSTRRRKMFSQPLPSRASGKRRDIVRLDPRSFLENPCSSPSPKTPK